MRNNEIDSRPARAADKRSVAHDYDKPLRAQDLHDALREIASPALKVRATETFLYDLATHGVDLRNGKSFSLN